MSTLSESNEFNFREIFPYLSTLGGAPFNEDPDIYGDSIAEVIQDIVQHRGMDLKTGAIEELKVLLSYTDEEIERATWPMIGFDPTFYIEDNPNWGPYPTLRAFWTDVLHALENDPARRDTAPRR